MSEYGYLKSGERVRILYQDSEQAFVAVRVTHPTGWGGDEDWYEEDGQIVQVAPADVFEEPPVHVLHEEIAKLQERIDELRTEINGLWLDAREMEVAAAARMADCGGTMIGV